MPAVPETVLERDAELAQLRAAVAGAAAGEGALVLVTGAPGIGKTALLRAGREAAAAAGFAVLGATASELDRGFPFGVVHQLLDGVMAGADPERRARLLAGTARHAEAVLGDRGAGGLGEDPGYLALHGLYWLVANLAEERPLALVVDDLHWADPPSVRLLEYLGRRLEGLPLVVVATTRPNEPGADAALLAELAGGPSALVLRPGPLGADAAHALVAGALGHAPEPAFTRACLEATGGNPLLLRALAGQAVEHALRGTADEAGRVAALGAGGVAPVVQRRLDVLGPDATALARAAVVLGDRHRLDELGAIAGLAPEAAAAAADRLVAADLLAPGSWDFVHPVVREAVAETLAPAERNRLHALAAARLTDDGARPEEVAVHLVQTEPAGDPAVVATLRAAARGAAAEAAPEAAIDQLRRALAEPPGPAEAPAVLLELGELEARAQQPAEAIGHLGEALELGLEGDEAARALSTQGALTLLVEPAPALPMFERALAVATDPALRLRLESLLLEALTFTDAGLARRHELLDAARVDPDASPVALAALAHESGWSAAPVAETLAFVRRATLTDRLLDVVGPGNSTYNLLIHAARYAEAPDIARHLLEQGERAAQRTATRQAALFLEHAWGYWHLFFGSVAAGRAQAETGLARTREAGYGIVGGALAAILGDLLVEQDDLDEAARVIEDVDPAAEETIVGPFVLASRGQIRWRQRRIEEAEADLRRSIDQLDRRGWLGPLVSSSRLRLAELLGERGERDEAVDRARACAAVAERAGTPGALGASLRVAGLNLGGDEGIAVLEQAVAALAGSTLALEHGWALHDLGAALRRAGRRADARAPLRQAVEVAARAEAPWLARQARDELAATGARVQRESLRGPAALTPSERRVVELAAQGLRNREIAESLWVTRKTVEVHLGNAYGKLGIRSRAQLADALAPLAEAPAA